MLLILFLVKQHKWLKIFFTLIQSPGKQPSKNAVCPTASQILLLIQGDLLILYVAQIPRVASLASVMNALALCFFESVSDEDLRFMITWYQ